MPRRLTQQRVTFSYLEWQFHASRAISAVCSSWASCLSYLICNGIVSRQSWLPAFSSLQLLGKLQSKLSR